MRIPAVLGLIAALVLGGCADQPGADDLGEADQDVTTAFANDKAAFDFFVAKGLTNFQAAGIVGNLDQESGVNPNSVQSGGPGRGIAQWSVGGRWDSTAGGKNVLAYAAAHNENAHSLQAQLEFIWFEFQNVGYGYTQLKATTNVTDATVAFMARYEICGNCIQTQRVNYAKAVLNAYGQIPYGGAFVSQSWPLAAEPALQVKCGETVAAKIVLKNTGTKTWTATTKLGTTKPRDRASIFAGADWAAANRPASISGSVAPGANGTFTFSFNGPTGAACVPGTYKEYFGLVEEGGSWFSDAGNSGPADDQIEALIELVAADDSGSNAGSDGGTAGSDYDGGDGSDAASPGTQAGCSVGGSSNALGGVLIGALASITMLGRRKRRTVRA